MFWNQFPSQIKWFCSISEVQISVEFVGIQHGITMCMTLKLVIYRVCNRQQKKKIEGNQKYPNTLEACLMHTAHLLPNQILMLCCRSVSITQLLLLLFHFRFAMGDGFSIYSHWTDWEVRSLFGVCQVEFGQINIV